MYHAQVRRALEKEGWTITSDPLALEWEDTVFFPDLGADRVIAAEKGIHKIAVEIKSFLGPYFLSDFYEAIGQYDNYAIALSEMEPDRKLVLAISSAAYEQFFQKKSVQKVLEIKKVALLIIDVDNQTIEAWIR